MQKHLKPLRVIISLFFLITASLIFIDFREFFSESFISGFLSLQFAPSVMRFIHILGISFFGFLFILLLTALFGRVYCSTICPLGIFQDVISWISKKVRRKKRPYSYSPPRNKLRYSLLAVTVIFLLFGSVLALNLLDPYSNFGRFFTYFAKPVAVWVNNNLTGIVGGYTLYRVSIPPIPWQTAVFPALMLVLVVGLSYKYGRLYCNTICPVGTFLGLISKYSLFRIRIGEKCTGCAHCVRVCKSSCIDFKTKGIDFTRCVNCMNCLRVCEAVRYRYSGAPALQRVSVSSEANEKTDKSKRQFLLMVVASLLGLKSIASAANSRQTTTNRARRRNQGDEPEMSRESTIPENRQNPVSPPGSVSIEKFNKSCTACGLCVSECPGHVLQPSFMEYGLIGFMQPHMDFRSGFCNFDCTKCGEICPTGAIQPLTVEKKHRTQTGVAIFIQENCIVFVDHTDCGACSEHCPTRAVDMVPFTGNLHIPEVTENICIGCGACEYACPVEPYKAIYVEGNPRHELADRPEHEKLEQPDTEDFPF